MVEGMAGDSARRAACRHMTIYECPAGQPGTAHLMNFFLQWVARAFRRRGGCDLHPRAAAVHLHAGQAG